MQQNYAALQIMASAKQSILPKPDSCHEEVYILMKSCWDLVPEARNRPREIIRNIRSLLARGLLTSNLSF